MFLFVVCLAIWILNGFFSADYGKIVKNFHSWCNADHASIDDRSSIIVANFLRNRMFLFKLHERWEGVWKRLIKMHPKGGGVEHVGHSHVVGWKSPLHGNWSIQFLFNENIFLFLHWSSLLGSSVLKPDLHLK